MASEEDEWQTELNEWKAKLTDRYNDEIAQAFIDEIGEFYESKQELIDTEFEEDVSEQDQYSNSSLLESLDGKECVFFESLINNESKATQFWRFFNALAFGKEVSDMVVLTPGMYAHALSLYLSKDTHMIQTRAYNLLYNLYIQ